MLKKTIFIFILLPLIINNMFSQAISIDTSLANAARDITEGVPSGSKIAILNVTSDSTYLSDYIINELIVNLVNTRLFQIVPRSTVELAAARKEFAFQMSGDVSDDSQKRVGQFLEADTIITGTVTKDSKRTYRLIINAIHLENFAFQSSFSTSIQNDKQVKTLIANKDGVSHDYTVGQRFGIGAVNMFFGLGSVLNGQYLGFITMGVELFGLPFLIPGLGLKDVPYPNPGPFWEWDSNERRPRVKKGLIIAGSTIIGTGMLFGYIIPFFHHKSNYTNISQNVFPFNFELVSLNNQDINGFRILYNIKF